MTLKWVPIHEITRFDGEDSRCFVCREKAEYVFAFFHNTTREKRRYCRKHALKASKRHHIKMPE